MIGIGVLCLILGTGGANLGQSPIAADTSRLRPPALDTSFFISVPKTVRVDVTRDTIRDTIPSQRRRSVAVSEWYSRRLTIHRYAAYTAIPVFALQYAAGSKLYDESADAPSWAKNTHRVGATALAGIFTVNTVTGLWNLWDSRSQPKGRTLRTIHALSMLGADAAFTYAGVKLSNEAENSAEKRRQHRTVALSAIALSAASGIGMKLLNR
jgi:hypothetical protein